MIVKSYIQGNLYKIEHLYNKSVSTQNGLFYSKLAVIELCGWIEMSMDDMVMRLSIRLLKKATNRKYIEKEIVRRTYGFDYEKHFRPMIEAIIGRSGIECLEANVNPALFQPMIGALSSLKTTRDQLAHQYIKGTTLVIDSPSVTRSRFQLILKGLCDLERVLKKCR